MIIHYQSKKIKRVQKKAQKFLQKNKKNSKRQLALFTDNHYLCTYINV
mgnify:CR=1 FL=1